MNIFIVGLIILVFFISFILYYYLVYRERYVYDALRRQGIPGEPFVPLFGQMRAIRKAREDGTLMEYHLELAKKHGPIFLIGYGPLVRLVVLDPDLLSDVFGRSFADFYRKPIDFTTVLKPIIGEHNLLVSEGIEHNRARKMLNPAFHFTNLHSMISIMIYHTEKSIAQWLSFSNNEKVNLTKELNTLTLSIIASCAFGQSFETSATVRDTLCETFPEMLETVMYRTMHMVNLIPGLAELPFFRKHIIDQGMQKLTRIIDDIIVERRQGISTSICNGSDLLDLLLSAADENGRSFTDDEIRDQALTFILAGHDTTGNLMVWILYVLMTYPDVHRACQQEVDSISSRDSPLQYEYLNRLPICEAVIMETLRLYPPAPLLTRYCTKEHTIGQSGKRQIHIPRHTTIWLNLYSLHRQEEFWPRPDEFDYTRFLRDPNTKFRPKLAHPFCFLPFAAGTRDCIGQNFALLEAKVILFLLLKHCNFYFEPGQTVKPDVRITMRPKNPLFARLYQRF